MTSPNRLDPVGLHQPSDTALANVEPHFLPHRRHRRTIVAAKTRAKLFPDILGKRTVGFHDTDYAPDVKQFWSEVSPGKDMKEVIAPGPRRFGIGIIYTPA